MGYRRAFPGVHRAIRSNPPPSTSSFFRKPIIVTPTPPTQLRTFYLRANSESGGTNTGTELNPFQSVANFEAIKQPGDMLYFKGDFTGAPADFIGSGSTVGTSTDPIQYAKKPGISTPTITLGGPAGNDWPAFYGRDYHYLSNVNLAINAGAGYAVQLDYVTGCKFFGVVHQSSGFRAFHSTNCENWDGGYTGVAGSTVSNSGDAMAIGWGSNNFRLMRWNGNGTVYHSMCTIGAVNADTTQTSGIEVFDCVFRNPGAAGVIMNGGALAPHVHWNEIKDCATQLDGGAPLSRNGIQISCPDAIVEFNRIRNCQENGIMMSAYQLSTNQQVNRCRVRFNSMTKNAKCGLYLHCGPSTNANTDFIDNIIENNICWDNHQLGAIEGGGYYAGFYEPIWVDQYAGGCTPWPIASNNWGGNIIRNNLMAKDTSDTKFMTFGQSINGGSQVFTLAQFVASNAASTGNIVATDPLFVDESTLNYRLQAGSPCINTGYPTSGVTYLESAPDMGVYEYGGSD